MIQKILAKIFNVSPEVIEFISDSKNNFKQRLIVLAPLTAWASFFAAISPLILKLIIDSLTSSWTSFAGIPFGSAFLVFTVIIAGLGTINLLDNIFNYFKQVLLLKVNQQTETFIEDKFMHFLTKFDGAFLGSENNLRLIRNLQWSLQPTQTKMLQIGQDTIQTIVGVTTLIFIIPLIHPFLVILIIISVLVDTILDYYQNQSWRSYELLESRQSSQKNELNWRIIWHFNRLLENGWIGQILDSYKGRRKKWLKTAFAQKYNDQVFALFRNFSTSLLRVGTLFIAGWLFLNGKIEIGTLVVFELYITQIKNQMQSFGNIFRNLIELRFELFRYDFLIHIKPKLDYSITNKPVFNGIKTLTISNINFSYPKFYEDEKAYLKEMKERISGVENAGNQSNILSSIKTLKENIKKAKNSKSNFVTRQLSLFVNWIKLIISNHSLSMHLRKDLVEELDELDKMFNGSQNDNIILNQINLKFEKGKIYGIVGQNGAGKTTLMKLIKRSIDTTSGDILIGSESISDEYKIKNIEPLFWKNYIGNIDQNNFLWEALTVRENLFLGLNATEIEQINDEEIYTILKQLELDKKIDNLDLIIGENLELSGGQQQLLEIARIVLQKKPIIILDEATNQLDANNEELVINLLQTLKQNSIIIFITHRMTTTNKCDEIIILEDGKVTNINTPAQLLNMNGANLFKTFWEKQVSPNLNI
jgi:ABC-type multidrug transport system fused ATPase/permease subunit